MPLRVNRTISVSEGARERAQPRLLAREFLFAFTRWGDAMSESIASKKQTNAGRTITFIMYRRGRRDTGVSGGATAV